MKRRDFCAITAVAALGSLLGSQAHADTTIGGASFGLITAADRKWRMDLSRGFELGTIARREKPSAAPTAASPPTKPDFSTSARRAQTGVLVYDRDGKLLKTIANEYPEVHSLVYANENNEEYFYVTVQKGTPKENWLFVKMKTDGTVVQKITAPREAGFHAPNEWRLTAAVPGPDGSIYIANGYGDSRIFKFDKAGNYQGGLFREGKRGRPVQLQPRAGCGHALRSAAAAGVRPRKPASQPLRFRRQVREQCHSPPASSLPGEFLG